MSAEMARLTRRMYGECFRKKRYEEHWQALGVLRSGKAKGKDFGRAYHCDHCHGWHLGRKR